MKRVVLLLTGTVNPGQMILTRLLDPDERRAQYISSLKYWLEKTNIPIVFVENSGVDLSDMIAPKHKDRIEFLVFQGNDYPKHLGKGYGELKCLQFASENSTLLKGSDFVFKVTGRYKVMNFEKFHTFYQQNYNTFVFLDLKASLTFADSRLFGFEPSFISYLSKYEDDINDSENKVFENILAKAALDAVVSGRSFKQMPFYPELIGVSGTDNTPYASDFFYFKMKQIKYFLKARFMEGY